MKARVLRFVTLVVTVFMLTGCATATKEEVEKVKNTAEINFGGTMEEIKASYEKAPIEESKDKIVYQDKFADYEALLLYVFDEDGNLKDFFIKFMDKYDTKAEYEKRYLVVGTALEYLHGEPEMDSKESAIWKLQSTTILLKMDKETGDTSILFSGNKK